MLNRNGIYSMVAHCLHWAKYHSSLIWMSGRKCVWNLFICFLYISCIEKCRPYWGAFPLKENSCVCSISSRCTRDISVVHFLLKETLCVEKIFYSSAGVILLWNFLLREIPCVHYWCTYDVLVPISCWRKHLVLERFPIPQCRCLSSLKLPAVRNSLCTLLVHTWRSSAHFLLKETIY